MPPWHVRVRSDRSRRSSRSRVEGASCGGSSTSPMGRDPFRPFSTTTARRPGLVNNEAFDAIAPAFVARGWAFFAPYRRGQGLSADAGRYVMDEIASARARGGMPAAAEEMTRLLVTDHLDDQMAALDWLRRQPFVR